MPLLLMGIKLLLEQGMRVLGLNKRDPVIIDLFLGEVMSFEWAQDAFFDAPFYGSSAK
jgi:hypothetical protein